MQGGLLTLFYRCSCTRDLTTVLHLAADLRVPIWRLTCVDKCVQTP